MYSYIYHSRGRIKTAHYVGSSLLMPVRSIPLAQAHVIQVMPNMVVLLRIRAIGVILQGLVCHGSHLWVLLRFHGQTRLTLNRETKSSNSNSRLVPPSNIKWLQSVKKT